MVETDVQYTVADYEQLPEGAPYQLIDGELIMSPSPTPNHQRVLRKLSALFDQIVTEKRQGEIFFAPLDVYLGETEVYQPDLLFIARERLHILTDKNVQGAPDLVLEILSVGTSYYDLTHKKRTYESAGVRECWIVDPMKRRIEVYENRDGVFSLAGQAQRSGEVTSLVLEGFTVDLEQVFS